MYLPNSCETEQKRPALRPAYRSAKVRTSLPPNPIYPIPLPAPSKSHCIRLIQLFFKDPSSAVAAGPPSPTAGKRGEASPAAGGVFNFGSNSSKPSTPTNAPGQLPGSAPPSPQVGTHQTSSSKSAAAYVFELLSEYLTREKREYMLKSRWAKSGRDSLAKDFNEIEQTFCAGGATASLIPTFLTLRREFGLPPSQLPAAVIEQYEHLVAPAPEGDEVPLREVTVQTATGALYQNPRLSQADAVAVLTELVEAERERGEWNARLNEGQWHGWIEGVLEAVEKRVSAALWLCSRELTSCSFRTSHTPRLLRS